MSREELVRRRLDEASRRIQSTVETRARRRSGLHATISSGLQSPGFEGNDEEVTSVCQRRASLDNKDDGVALPTAEQLLQRRLREARARIRIKVDEASTTDYEPKSSSCKPTTSRARATRRSSLPKLLQQHMANDSTASVAKSYAASPRDNVHLFDSDIDMLPSAPIWPSHSGSATSRTVQQSRSYPSSSDDESLLVSGLEDSVLLEQVAKELASTAPRHDSSGEIVITAGGNLKGSTREHDFYDDDYDDDDSLQGSVTKAVPLLDSNRVDGKDGLRVIMKGLCM